MPRLLRVRELWGGGARIWPWLLDRLYGRETDDSLGLECSLDVDPVTNPWATVAANNMAKLAAVASGRGVVLRPAAYPLTAGTIAARVNVENGATVQASGVVIFAARPVVGSQYWLDTSQGGSYQFRAVGTLDPTWWGFATTATAAVNGAALNAAILAASPFGRVKMPATARGTGARWLYQGPLIGRRGVEVIGYGRPKRSNLAEQEGVLIHIPALAGEHAVELEAPGGLGYTEHVGFKRLSFAEGRIFGLTALASGDCFHLDAPLDCHVRDIAMLGFVDGVSIWGGQSSTFKRIIAQQQTGHSERIRAGAGALTTTITFSKCYSNGAAKPWVVEQDAGYNIVFRDCIDENSPVGGEVCKGSHVELRAHYTENIPNDGSAKALLTVGKTGVAPVYTTHVTIIGGTFAGFNGAFAAGSSWIDADVAEVITAIGAEVRRVGKALLTTANTKAVNHIGCNLADVGPTPWSGLNPATAFYGQRPVMGSPGGPWYVDQALIRLAGLTVGKGAIAKGGTAVWDLSLNTLQAVGIVRFFVDVAYATDATQRSVVKIEIAAKTGAAGGGALAPVLILNGTAGNFAVVVGDFVVSYPAAGVVRVTYTNNNVANANNAYGYAEGIGLAALTVA